MQHKTKITTIGTALLALVAATGAIAEDLFPSNGSLRFSTVATAAQEVAPTESDAVGVLVARFDPGLTQVQVRLRLSDINTMVLAAHFHCARAGVNGPIAFGLLGPGPLTEIIDDASVTLTNADNVFAGACVDAIGRPVDNIAALYFAMRDGLIYLNVHTPAFPAGEVRGQLLEVDD